jgi:biotin carboxylase
VARGAVIGSLDHARALVRQTGYPLVVKPDAGVGAMDTHKIASDEELERLFAAGPATAYIAEEFIAGELCSFDGLTDRNGGTVFTTAHRFSQGIMETVNEARDLYYVSMRQIPAELEAAGRKCLAAFDVRERFFHIEFFRTAADTYVALEVNMRPPGGFTTDMFNYAGDIDIYRIWAELVVHDRRGGPYERKYHCAYATRRNRFHYARSHAEIMARFGEQIVQVGSVPGVFSSALGDTGYIFRSPELAQIEEMVAYIQELKTQRRPR